MTPTLISQARAVSRRRQEPTDWYTIGLAVLIGAGLPVQMAVGVATRSYRPGAFVGAPVAFTVELVAIMLAALVTAAIAVGPVRADRAEYSCVLSGPLDRRRELRHRFVVSSLAAGLLGAVVGVTAVVLSAADVDNVLGGAVAGAALGATAIHTTTVLQAASPTTRTAVQRGGAVVGLTALILMAFVASPPAIAPSHGAVWLTAVVVGLAAAVGTGWVAWSTVAVLDRMALAAGNTLAIATTAAVVFLDPDLLGGVLAERRLARSRVSRSRTFPAGRIRALLAADVWRSIRNGPALAVAVAAMLVPYAAGRVAPDRWVPVVALVAGAVAVAPFAAGFRQITASRVLRRMLGGTDGALRLVHVVVPATLSVLFAIATEPAAPGHLVAALWVPVGILLTIWVRTWGRQAELTTAIADVGMGPVPVGLILTIARGLGPLALVALIQLQL